MAEHQKGGATYYLLPGGGVDPGEGWDEAAVREVGEELGVAARADSLLGLFENRSPDGSRHILHAIFRGELEGDPAPTGEDPRVVGCRWVGPGELEEITVFPDLAATFRGWLEEAPPGGASYGKIAWVDG
jgi:8-oxo-dGTP pyrophosphatase MutT (NUDIX family)